MPAVPKNIADAITAKIEDVTFIQSLSAPNDMLFVHSYRVEITNASEYSIIIKNRHWDILNGNRKVKVHASIVGQGAVSEISPQSSSIYYSLVITNSKEGEISGYFDYETPEKLLGKAMVGAVALHTSDAEIRACEHNRSDPLYFAKEVLDEEISHLQAVIADYKSADFGSNQSFKIAAAAAGSGESDALICFKRLILSKFPDVYDEINDKDYQIATLRLSGVHDKFDDIIISDIYALKIGNVFDIFVRQPNINTDLITDIIARVLQHGGSARDEGYVNEILNEYFRSLSIPSEIWESLKPAVERATKRILVEQYGVAARESVQPQLSPAEFERFRSHLLANPWIPRTISPSEHIIKICGEWLGHGLTREHIANVQPNLIAAYAAEIHRNKDRRISTLVSRSYKLAPNTPRPLNVRLASELTAEELEEKRRLDRERKRLSRSKSPQI